MTRLLVVDNYDSFTYNLVHGLAAAGAEAVVKRNDAVTRDAIARAPPDGIVLSPGPGHPGVARDFGVCADLIRTPLDPATPMLGVCLGMQGMAHHTGGQVVRAPRPVHGEATPVRVERRLLFSGLPETVQTGRYHSLVVDEASLPDAWRVTARGDGLVMGIAHKQRPWFGVQFHPESILTPDGPTILRNFVEMCR